MNQTSKSNRGVLLVESIFLAALLSCAGCSSSNKIAMDGSPAEGGRPDAAVDLTVEQDGPEPRDGPVADSPAPPLPAPVCTVDRWCWQSPLPQGAQLNAVWSGGPAQTFAVGVAGTILHHDGQSWARMATSSDWPILSIWGSSPADLYAVGGVPGSGDTPAVATLLHYQGSVWSPVAPSALHGAHGFFSVWGSGPDDVYVIAAYGTILHYDGLSWSVVQHPFSDQMLYLTAIWGSGPDDIFAVGQEGMVLHYDGASWELSYDLWGSGHVLLQAVWGSGPTDVFAVGDSMIIHYDGSDWSTMPAPDASNLNAVWGRSPTDVYAAGSVDNHGAVLHYDGQAWSVVFSAATSAPLRGLHGVGAAGLIAVGDNGVVVRFDGSAWSEEPAAESQFNLGSSVWGSGPTDVFAAGNDGIQHYDGQSWTLMPSSSGAAKALWGSGPADVFAASNDGIQHYDGQSWTLMPSSSKAAKALWGSGPTDVFAAGRDCKISHYDGSSWSPMDAGLDPCPLSHGEFSGLWGTGPQDVYAIGSGQILEGNSFVHYDGESWSTVDVSPLQIRFGTALWGKGSQDIYAAGSFCPVSSPEPCSALLHFDGTTWELVTLPDVGGAGELLIYGLWGSGPSDVYAVGGSVFYVDGVPRPNPRGIIYHFDGQGWTKMVSGAGARLSGVWGSGQDDVFVIGAGQPGAILHRGPL